MTRPSRVGGFDQATASRLQATFARYRDPHSKDINKDELAGVLLHLGYMHVEEADVLRIADEVTKYSTLELDDFMAFMQKYAELETAKYRQVFEAFDEDNSGYLDADEVMKFLKHLGYTPLRGAVDEAIHLVDLDRSGRLEFEEVALLMHLYRSSEGFTKGELERFTAAFGETDRLTQAGAGEEAVPAEKLTSLLTRFYGIAKWETAQKVTDDLMAAAEKKPQKQQAADAGHAVPLGVQFSEALVWARKLRDKEFADYRTAFAKFDADGSGFIDRQELREVLTTLGYTLTDRAVRELLERAQKSGACHELHCLDELDYDNFVHFMQLMSETDGFMESELVEIAATFAKFDEDGSGDIDAVELGDVLTHMGYTASLEKVQSLLARVDYDHSGVLDLREFTRFVRLHRETVLASMRSIFDELAEEGGVLSEEAAREAFVELLENDEVDSLRSGPQEAATGSREGMEPGAEHVQGALTFDGFVEAAEALRAKRAREVRKRAGFTDGELQRFQELFDAHDTHRDGTLAVGELTNLLATLGFPLRTLEEREEVMRMLDDAKAKAVEHGAAADDGEVNFGVVVQLLRTLHKKDDRSVIDRLSRVAEELRFSPGEVAEFQEVFSGWYEADVWAKSEAAQELPTGRPPSAEEGRKALTGASLIRLLRSLGMKLETRDRAILDSKLKEVAPGGRVEFAEFLSLMRWMTDTNFADIAKVVPQAGARGDAGEN